MIAEAELQTDQANHHLIEICRQLEQKAKANPELGVHVEWSDTNATIDFGWGRCTMHAGATTLTLRAEAADDDGLRQIRELITRHLENQAGDDRLTVTWRQDGATVVDTHTERRDTMRAFHRRMRH